MSFTNVFGGNTIFPSDVSYLSIALSADTPLEWPLESSGTEDPAARIIDVTPDASGYSIILPDATLTGAGQTILFNNIDTTYSFFVDDHAGNTIATVAAGTQWQVYLSDTTTVAGTWRVFNYGASTATVQPSALAGYGLTVTSNTLSQSVPVTTFTVSPRTVLTTDRASMLTWTGTGLGTLNLPSAATAGANYFVSMRNAGGGDLTVTPAGADTIDGDVTFVLSPGDSATLVTDGIVWYSLGFGQDAAFAFDFTSISLTSQTSPYTLASTELNRIAYQFIGVLGTTMEIIVPSTVQQYWVDNQTTGSYTLSLKTSTQAVPVVVQQGYAAILYCNGADVVLASASTATLPSTVGVAQGGTGISSYATGDIIYASATSTLTRLAAVATGNALISAGVGTAPAYGKISLTTTVSGILPVANGGTGTTTSTGTGNVVLATSPTLTTPTLTTPTATNLITSGSITEGIYTITDGAAFEINPGNGTVQYITLGANRTPKGTSFANGQSITLFVSDAGGYSITWTDATFGSGGVKWISAFVGGGSAPSLATTGYTIIVLEKSGSQVYGVLSGYVS